MKLYRKKQQQNDTVEAAEKKDIMRYFSMTGLMVPVLLLSILFVRLVMNDIEQPKSVREAIAKDRVNLSRRLNLVFSLLATRDTRIETDELGQKTVINLKAVDGKFDLKGIHKVAVQLKQKYPEVFRAIINVTDKIAQKEIKKVLESIRKREKADPEIFLVDEVTGKKISLKVMFTDIVFSNDKTEG